MFLVPVPRSSFRFLVPQCGLQIYYITNSRFVQSSSVLNVFLSDHFAIGCCRKKAREKKNNVYRTLRDYKNYNKDVLVDLLKVKVPTETYVDYNDPNVMWDILYKAVYEILSVMCHYKRYKQRETPTPWLNADIYRAMRYRDSLIGLYKVTGKKLYLTMAKQHRNIVNSMIESAKKLYITTLLNNNSTCF